MLIADGHGCAIHLIGVGGSGMSALAHLLLQSGYEVSGSDMYSNKALVELEKAGACIYVGHHADNIKVADAVVYSPAIPATNDELRAARAAGVTLFTRANALANLLSEKQLICVAGSHGKSTTAAMLTHILAQAGFDPGFYIGASVPVLNHKQAAIGKSKYFVLEACEAFRALQYWHPCYCIITNISDEHIDHYGGQGHLETAFSKLAARVSEDGLLTVYADNQRATLVSRDANCRVLRYDCSGRAPLTVNSICLKATHSRFTLYQGGERLGHVNMPVPGQHNITNALAATAIALELGVTGLVICKALNSFTGVERRWQSLGHAKGVRVFDDYAHHPLEVTASLLTARQSLVSPGRLLLVFEPQLFSRAERHQLALGEALSAADIVLLAPIDGAGEVDNQLGSIEKIAAEAEKLGCEVVKLDNIDAAAKHALRIVQEGDLVVTMGPGNVAHVGEELLALLKQSTLVQNVHSVASPYLPNQLASPSIASGPVVALLYPTVLPFIESQVQQCPHIRAVSMADKNLSYTQLWQATTIIASNLRASLGNGRRVVAVYVNGGMNRTLACLAVLRAGYLFLPLDLRLPTARLEYMLKDSAAAALLVDPLSRTNIPGLQERMFCLDKLCIARQQNNSTLPVIDGLHGAYIIYTSGSSGLPKGCEINHMALSNLVTACIERFEINHTSRVLQAGAFGFDVAIGDMFMGLCAGARLVFPEDDYERHGSPLVLLIENQAVTHVSMTPSALAVLPQRSYPELTHVIVAGEVCSEALLVRWAPDRKFYNAYGPTEATIYATIATCRSGGEVMIGAPIQNVEIAVLDNNGAVVERGQKGELWLAGAGLVTHYLNRPLLSSELFKQFRLPGSNFNRWYRTFDEVCLHPDGQLQYFGRLDRQIKLRGARIELGEIEVLLQQHPQVAAAATDVRKDAVGRDQLVAWILYVNEALTLDDKHLHEFLRTRLPAYMVPASYVQLRSLPKTINGKLDRSALPAPELFSNQREVEITRPSNEIEAKILEIFQDELQFNEEFGTRHVFEELGIDSLSVAIILLVVEKQFGIQIPGKAMAFATTVELLSLHVQHSLQQLSVVPNQTLPIDPRFQDDIQLALAKQYEHRWKENAWIFSTNPQGNKPPLFFVTHAMTTGAASQLAKYLGPNQPIHGLMSGHKTMHEYTNVNFLTVAKMYISEIMEIQPEGPIQIAGNCGGGTLAREIAILLIAAGREVSLLIMLEQGRFPAYSGRVAILFGIDSFANPYARLAQPEKIMQLAYPGGYSLHPVPGIHGEQFNKKNIVQTALVIEQLLDEVQQVGSESIA